MLRIAVVVPCYNERARMSPGEWLDFLAGPDGAGIHFFFSDDGSTDGTRRVLRDLCAATERAHLLHFPERRGKGEVIRRAVLNILVAGERGGVSFDYVGFWDADLATPLGELPALRRLAQEHGYDGILCSRVRRLGAVIRRRPLRHALGRVFATAASLMLDLPAYDTQCGAKIFRTEAVAEVMREPFVSSWIFDVEIILRMKRDGCVDLYEYPVGAWTEMPGSKMRIRDIFRIPVELLKICRRYR